MAQSPNLTRPRSPSPRLKAPSLPRLSLAPIRSRGSLALDGQSVKVRGIEEPLRLPDYLPWDEFLPWMAERWKVGEHIAMASTTESGKTTFAIRILQQRDFVVVMGTKRRDPSLYKPLEERGFVRRDKWTPWDWRETGERYVIYAPPLEIDPESTTQEVRQARETQAEKFRSALIKIYHSGGWTVYLDEIGHLQDLGLADILTLLYREARSENVTLIAGTQRPRNVPVVMFALANWYISWRMSDRQDRYRASEFVGSLSQVFDVTAERLPRYEFVAVHKPTDSIVRSKVDL